MEIEAIFGIKKGIFRQTENSGQQASAAASAMGATTSAMGTTMPAKNSEWIETQCRDAGKLRPQLQ